MEKNLTCNMFKNYESFLESNNFTSRKILSKEQKEFLQKCNVNVYEIDEKGLINVTGSVTVRDSKLEKFPVKFGKISKNFSCYQCHSLITLEGAPHETGKDFIIKDLTSLTSLKYGPIKVGGDFDCNGCEKLYSLNYSPKEIGEDFNCSNCNSIKTLEGLPNIINGYFNCSYCVNLISLKGAPVEVKGFNCMGCDKLKTTEYAPNKIKKSFCFHQCYSLETLKYLPENVEENYIGYDCSSIPKWQKELFKTEGDFHILSNKKILQEYIAFQGTDEEFKHKYRGRIQGKKFNV